MRHFGWCPLRASSLYSTVRDFERFGGQIWGIQAPLHALTTTVDKFLHGEYIRKRVRDIDYGSEDCHVSLLGASGLGRITVRGRQSFWAGTANFSLRFVHSLGAIGFFASLG